MRQSELQQIEKLETPAEMTGAHINKSKECPCCGEVKPLTGFNKHRGNKDGLQWHCRICQSATTRRWQSANKDKHNAAAKRYYYGEKGREYRELHREELKAYHADWRKQKPEKYREYKRKRRARKASNSDEHFSQEEFVTLCESYGNKCLGCGTTDRLEADHVIPLVSGGPDGIDNIQPLCRICNAKKGTLAIDLR